MKGHGPKILFFMVFVFVLSGLCKPSQALIANIAGGGFHTIALKSDGTVWTWGNNGAGQLGVGSSITYSPTPMKVNFPLYVYRIPWWWFIIFVGVGALFIVVAAALVLRLRKKRS
jgi:hypothetical protein